MRCPWRRGFSCGCLCGRLLLWVGLRGCQSCWDSLCERYFTCWAEARLKIARMTLTIKLDGNWSSFQLANSAPPLSVTDSAIAPSARMRAKRKVSTDFSFVCSRAFFVPCSGNVGNHHTELRDTLLPRRVCCARLCAMPVQHLEASEQAQEDILPSKN